MAMAVEDRFQGKGIAHSSERLALLAARAGFTRFWAITHATTSAGSKYPPLLFPIDEKLSR